MPPGMFPANPLGVHCMRLLASPRRSRRPAPSQICFDFERVVAAPGYLVNGCGSGKSRHPDPTQAEIYQQAREMREAQPTTNEGPRDANPVGLFASNLVKLCVQSLSKWCRRWDKPAPRPREYHDALHDALLAHEWLFGDGELVSESGEQPVLSFEEASAFLAVCHETLREKILASLPPVPVFWLAITRGIEQACRPSPA